MNRIFKITLSLLVVFSVGISHSVYASEDVSIAKLAEIEIRISQMDENQLLDRRLALISEQSNLWAEQATTQSPSVSKNITSKLAEIAAELSAIQKPSNQWISN